jgi:hypothetical protein
MGRNKALIFNLACLTLFSIFSLSADAEENKVILFSPTGIAKNVRQVRAQFLESMVSFGDPRAHIKPFEINCPEKGAERWADDKNWIYDFDRDLPGGIVCEFKLVEGIKSVAGHLINGEKRFVFSTGGPSVTEVKPGSYGHIE